MAYNLKLADRVRNYLTVIPNIEIEEKTMFGGIAFMVNGKMCINVSGNNLMCRYDAAMQDEIAEKSGYMPMIIKGKQMNGYCFVSEEGYSKKKDFEYWLDLCISFNDKAKVSKKKK